MSAYLQKVMAALPFYQPPRHFSLSLHFQLALFGGLGACFFLEPVLYQLQVHQREEKLHSLNGPEAFAEIL